MSFGSGQVPAEELSKLRWRCRRGSLELDLIFQRFLEEHYQALPAVDRERFKRILALDDVVLLNYMNGITQPNEGDLNELIIWIRNAC